jgi:hypothetical protein
MNDCSLISWLYILNLWGSKILEWTLTASHMTGFINIFIGRAPLDNCSARRKGLYQHRTQHRNTRTNIHASSGIRTHDISVQTIKTYVSDPAATDTDYDPCIAGKIPDHFASYL